MNEESEKNYEVAYLLSPLIPAESLVAAVETYIKKPIADRGGETANDWPPRQINLAYSIRKVAGNKPVIFREAFFGALRFRSSGETAAALAAKWRETPEVIRQLLVEVPRAVLAGEKRPRRPRLVRSARLDPAERLQTPRAESPVKPAMSVDELDKEIEQLLTTESYVPK